MAREPSADDLARAAAPPPTEPLGTMATTIGVVKRWRNEKGHGVIACEQTAPFDIWCHFSAIEAPGYRSFTEGQRVEVDYVRANQDSFKFVARRAKAIED